jgi:hypothetical protein
MSITIGDAVLKITGDTTSLDKSLDGIKGKVNSTTEATSGLANAFRGLLPALGVAAILSGFTKMISSTMKLAEDLDNMSIRTGIGVEALQILGYAAEMSGSSLQSLESIIKLMQTSIGQAAIKGDAAAESFTRLGLSFIELQSLSPDKQFYAIARAIESIPDPSERVAAYRDIFGRAGTEVAVYVKNLEDAGKLPIMTKEQIAQAAAANHAFEIMSISWGALKDQFALTVFPRLEPLINSLTTLVGWIGKAFDAWRSLPWWVQQLTTGGGGLSLFAAGINTPTTSATITPAATTSVVPIGGEGGIPIGEYLKSLGYANGGIAMSPQFARIAESGPEAIIPLSQMGGMGGTTLNIHVGNFMGDELSIRQFTRKISDILNQEERRSLHKPSQTTYYSESKHL